MALLHLGGVPRLTQKALDCIVGGGFRNLSDLDISWCRYVTNLFNKKLHIKHYISNITIIKLNLY